MHDIENCGKCGEVLRIEKGYITFKDGNVAYRRCPRCNTTSRISFDKVKHLKENSIQPAIEIEDKAKIDSIRPAIKIDEVPEKIIKPVINPENLDAELDDLRLEIQELRKTPTHVDNSELACLRADIGNIRADLNELKNRHVAVEVLKIRKSYIPIGKTDSELVEEHLQYFRELEKEKVQQPKRRSTRRRTHSKSSF